jgi:hypothetical protein
MFPTARFGATGTPTTGRIYRGIRSGSGLSDGREGWVPFVAVTATDGMCDKSAKDDGERQECGHQQSGIVLQTVMLVMAGEEANKTELTNKSVYNMRDARL